MVFKIKQPVSIGDLTNQIQIDELELASVSFNFEPERSDFGTAILSIVLVHRLSGHKTNVVYNDESALMFWKQIDAGGAVEKAVFDKLLSDKKLPDGTLT